MPRDLTDTGNLLWPCKKRYLQGVGGSSGSSGSHSAIAAVVDNTNKKLVPFIVNQSLYIFSSSTVDPFPTRKLKNVMSFGEQMRCFCLFLQKK